MAARVAADSALVAAGAEMEAAGAGAGAVFSATTFVTGRVASVAGCAGGNGDATPWGPVVSRLALATPATVITRVATRMPRFICPSKVLCHMHSKNDASSQALRAGMA